MSFLEILKLIPAILALWGEIKAILAQFKEKDRQNFLLDTAEAFKRVKSAKTPKEKSDAAKSIQAIIRRI